jgi:hypothetical protein
MNTYGLGPSNGAFGGHFVAYGKADCVGVYADAYQTASPGAGTQAVPLLVATNGTELLRVTTGGNVSISNGNLVIGTSGKGIDFSAAGNAAGMTSELLDDYEIGTWTPNQGGGLTVTGTFSSSGTYTKIGRQVFITFTLSGSTSIAIGGAGGAITTNIPFAAPSYFGVIYVGTNNIGFGVAGGNSSTVYSGGSVTGNSTITFSATYYTT